jgi:AraC-like DNA-binding protein
MNIVLVLVPSTKRGGNKMKIKTIQFHKDIPFLIEVKNIKKYPIHWHENITEIVLPIKGSIEVNVNFEKILVREGDFWFINNGSIHSITSDSGAIVISLYLDLNYFEKEFPHIKYMFFRSNIYNKGASHSKSDNVEDKVKIGYKTRFKNLFISLLMDAISKDSMAKELLMDSIYQLVSSMVKEFNWLQFLKKSSDKISQMQLDRYHRVVKYIHQHYRQKITLEDIAREEYITENYFSHFWKNLSSFSFNERLNYERVLKSQHLLLTSNMSISDIAYYCGFSHPKYYYKHFKKWFNCSPMEYRKACETYMEGPFDYENLKLEDIKKMIDEYMENIVLPEYAQNDIWKTTYLFDNFVKLKYLYKLDKIKPQSAPRNVVVDLFGSNNFKFKDNVPYFNWQNLDILVNFSETSDFNMDIRLRCSYLEKEWYKEAVNKFIDMCIYRYNMVTIEKWNFFINYNDEDSYNMANTIGDIITRKVPEANVVYFFEI